MGSKQSADSSYRRHYLQTTQRKLLGAALVRVRQNQLEQAPTSVWLTEEEEAFSRRRAQRNHGNTQDVCAPHESVRPLGRYWAEGVGSFLPLAFEDYRRPAEYAGRRPDGAEIQRARTHSDED